MQQYVYRELEAHQSALLGSVDRSERIGSVGSSWRSSLGTSILCLRLA